MNEKPTCIRYDGRSPTYKRSGMTLLYFDSKDLLVFLKDIFIRSITTVLISVQTDLASIALRHGVPAKHIWIIYIYMDMS